MERWTLTITSSCHWYHTQGSIHKNHNEIYSTFVSPVLSGHADSFVFIYLDFKVISSDNSASSPVQWE